MFFSNFLVILAVVGAAASTQSAQRPVDNMEHLIIFMQENRAFDHYFGTLKGVRGFNDRTPAVLFSGRDAFFQPITLNSDEAAQSYMLPFRTIANQTNAMCMPAPLMEYASDMGIWNHGLMDGWNTARDAGYGMAYFTREDLPYYYHLYDHFLVGDHYYQSTFTQTNPNRMHLFTGSNGLSVAPHDTCVLDNTEPRPGYTWPTAAEILQQANITWKVYQEIDNFDDNAFAWFKSFQDARPGDELYERGLRRYKSLFDELEKDMQAGTLPKVSWVIAPTAKSEHATNHPCAGEDFTARLLQVLANHPDVYAKSLFVLNYDEGGQFYDHAVPPTPPLSPVEGFSSVDVTGEVNTEVFTSVPAPIGLGFRVPLLLISPWTRGNLVSSEVLDHTSVLRFMESWLNITVPTISPWRRLVAGDLMASFDFAHPDYSWPTDLPNTADYVDAGDVECRTLPAPTIPTNQQMPSQEVGTRISRALPYTIEVSDRLVKTADTVHLAVSVANTGTAGVALQLVDLLRMDASKGDVARPRSLALAPDATFVYEDTTIAVQASNDGKSTSYGAVLYGPNGFLREFRGGASTTNAPAEVCLGTTATLSSSTLNEDASAKKMRGYGGGSVLQASLQYAPETEEVLVLLSVAADQFPSKETVVSFVLSDPAYGLVSAPQVINLTQDHSEETIRINTKSSGHWYDLIVSATVSTTAMHREQQHQKPQKDATLAVNPLDTSCFYRRFMGRMETGVDSISDPAMSAGVPNWIRLTNPEQYPRLPADFYALPSHMTEAVHKPTVAAFKGDKDAGFHSLDYHHTTIVDSLGQ